MAAKNQRGFSAVEIMITLAVAAAIGVTGFLAYNRMQDAGKAPSAAEQTDNASTPEAPDLRDDGDLDAAAQALDNTNLDAAASDAAELDVQTGSF